MVKIYREFDQGSIDWYRARLGIPTASMFHKIITPGGKASEQARKYAYRLVAERLLKESMDDPLHVEWVERGKEMEPHAYANFEFLNNVKLERIGFVTTDNGMLGCSPDALVVGRSQAVEIKCPAPWTHLGRLLDGMDTEYRPQVQGQLLVGEFEAVTFYSYHDRMPPFAQTTFPDRSYQKIMLPLLKNFVELLDMMTARARSLGAYAASTDFTTPFDQGAPAPEPLRIIVPE
jgi:hypothetical protein